MHIEFAQLLAIGDVTALRRAWRKVAPHLPQPATDMEAEIVMHNACTQAESIGFRHRAWSHRWLCERGLPSGLPDQLRPRAERLYPRIAEGVGIGSVMVTPATLPLRRVMQDAVLEVYADYRQPNPNVVRGRMLEMRSRERKRLLGGL